MMRRGCHIPQQGFPAFLPFISLPCLNECVHTSPPIPSLPLHPPPPPHPCLRLRCSARVTPRHCSVISGPRAASSEANQLDVALGARARNGPPSPAFLLSKDPLSLSHREDPHPPSCLWHLVCLLQTTSVYLQVQIRQVLPRHVSQTRRLLTVHRSIISASFTE